MKRSLSLGEGIAIFALLLFICGWPVMATWDMDDNYLKDLSSLDQIFVLLLIFGPPLWAAKLVGQITKKA